MKAVVRLRLLLILAPVFLSGCAQSLVKTTVRPDGSWARSVRFDPASPETTPREPVEDVFVLPEGKAWRIKRIGKGAEMIYTAERQLLRGAVLKNDVVIKGEDKRTRLIENTTMVRRIAPDKWEYRETLHWRGKRRNAFNATTDGKMRRAIKNVLPQAFNSDANVRYLEDVLGRETLKALFGPPDPLLGQFAFHPRIAIYDLTQRVGDKLSAAMLKRFGAKMSARQRFAAVRKIMVPLAEEAQAQSAEAGLTMNPRAAETRAPKQTRATDERTVAMTFSVRLPGKILSTNGKVNSFTGEVVWGLYSPATAVEDIEMTAIFQTSK